MKTGTIIAAIAGVLVLAAGIYMIDIDQTQETRLPDVTVEGGQLPEFDAEMGDIEVVEDTVTVPSLEVTPPADDS